MADYKHIIISIGASVLILGGIMLWMAYRNGEVQQLFMDESEPIPGPLSVENNELSLIEGDNMDSQHNNAIMNDSSNPRVTLNTNQGSITLELFQNEMPITVGNFLELAESGFYNGTKFHRVIDGFMIQGGDPNSKGDDTSIYGQGGPGYTIQDEFVSGELLTNTRGTIAMANTGQPNSGGSQFFINLVDNTGLDFDKEPLSSKHPVFGRVVAGIDAVDQIAGAETGARDIPNSPIVIESIAISSTDASPADSEVESE